MLALYHHIYLHFIIWGYTIDTTYEISPTTINLDCYNQPSSGEVAANPVVVGVIKYKCWKWIQTEVTQVSYI